VLEQDGAAQAAVSFTGAPVITLRDDADGQTRLAGMVASLVLGLFRDPANSALGREAG
jgi:hypothetical protein